MKRKSWIKQFGVHAAFCLGIVAVAFGMNQKINIERNHRYTMSEPSYTLLKGVEAKLEGNMLVLSGWGFDSDYYSEDSKCELILQNIGGGKDLWPRMKKNPKPLEIPRRYTDGKDYQEAVFEGKIEAGKLNSEKVYEVLLRYTSPYIDENGSRQLYVRTVTMDQFLYQGRMTEYNPKTFQAPEIAGTELEKELEGARLFHYFPEGMWVYYDDENLYYIVEKAVFETEVITSIMLMWYVRNTEDLPEISRKYGFANDSFYINTNEVIYPGIEKYRIWKTAIPSEKIISMTAGLYNNTEKYWILEIRKQIGDVFHEQ